jgi:hypothetical protein
MPARHALRSSEGRCRRHWTARPSLVFASCAHLLLAGRRNLPAKGAPARPRSRALGQAPAGDRQRTSTTQAARKAHAVEALHVGMCRGCAYSQPRNGKRDAYASRPRAWSATLFGTWAAARPAASGEDLGAARTGGSEPLEPIGHTGDSCAQSTEIVRKIRQSEGVPRLAEFRRFAGSSCIATAGPRVIRVGEVPGSNPGAPIKKALHSAGFSVSQHGGSTGRD